jgi:hypothetical protein
VNRGQESFVLRHEVEDTRHQPQATAGISRAEPPAEDTWHQPKKFSTGLNFFLDKDLSLY